MFSNSHTFVHHLTISFEKYVHHLVTSKTYSMLHCERHRFRVYRLQIVRILSFSSCINRLVKPRDPIAIYQKIDDTHPHRASPRITHQRHAKEGVVISKLCLPIFQVFLVHTKVLAINIVSSGGRNSFTCNHIQIMRIDTKMQGEGKLPCHYNEIKLTPLPCLSNRTTKVRIITLSPRNSRNTEEFLPNFTN
jgi:hypothetical protein